jgi:SAM-dependent methyltransferase
VPEDPIKPNEVNRSISDGDAMYGGNDDHYFSVGESALDNILHPLAMLDKHPNHILDFGCGAGRVTRWLSATFPGAVLEACDIRQEDIKFVATQFGAMTWESGVDVAKLKAPSNYDLIWVGSVFTHLSETISKQLLDRLASWLNFGGVLVFTSHGRKVSKLGDISGFYGIADEWNRVLQDYRLKGYGYADYPQTPGYGVSVTQLSWWANTIADRKDLRLISLEDHAWDDHQDVIAVQKK